VRKVSEKAVVDAVVVVKEGFLDKAVVVEPFGDDALVKGRSGHVVVPLPEQILGIPVFTIGYDEARNGDEAGIPPEALDGKAIAEGGDNGHLIRGGELDRLYTKSHELEEDVTVLRFDRPRKGGRTGLLELFPLVGEYLFCQFPRRGDPLKEVLWGVRYVQPYVHRWKFWAHNSSRCWPFTTTTAVPP